MAFERKWVSDSNLDKLWNDTIVKKEANKQRRSPDFCREAVLSATLKRISSEMSMRRFSSPMLDIDLNSDDDSDEDDDDNFTVLTNVTMNMDCSKNALKENDDEKTFTDLSTSKSLCHANMELKLLQNVNVMESSATLSVPAIGSPKRKRRDSDDDDLVTPSDEQQISNQCSPSKRQRIRNAIQSRSISRSMSPMRNQKHLHNSAVKSNSIENISNDTHKLLNIPKLKLIPCEDNSNILSKSNINSPLSSPVKSMVNSISELSIDVKKQWESTDTTSWCVPVPAPSHEDPLELDGFFNNLKQVTS